MDTKPINYEGLCCLRNIGMERLATVGNSLMLKQLKKRKCCFARDTIMDRKHIKL